MNWGYRIVISFVVFIGIILTMVVISLRQDVGLISEDYYKQEIAYQDQIERIRRTGSLEKQPEIGINRSKGVIQVDLPQETIEGGKIWLYRPSDNTLDRFYDLTNTGNMEVPLSDLVTGFWMVKVTWSHAGQEYYTEQSITL